MAGGAGGRCEGCRDGAGLPFGIAMAFQPILDAETGTVFAYEALVRGENGEGAGTVLAAVTEQNRYAFDQACRVTALREAHRLGIGREGARLSINFLPGAVYDPEACIRLTLRTARELGFPLERLIFEFTENETMEDTSHVQGIIKAYREFGFSTALDDFGAGYAGLGLLADFQTDIVKLDMRLIRGLDTDRARGVIVCSLVQMLHALDIAVVAEGIETAGELAALRTMGVRYVQGYHLARPAFMALPGRELWAPRLAA